MNHKIIVREKKDIFNDHIVNILNNNFGENRHPRTVYLYPKKSLIRGLSFVSRLNEDLNTVIGTITFNITLVSNIKWILLGPIVVSNFFRLSSKNLKTKTLGEITYDELLIKELKKRFNYIITCQGTTSS